MFLVLVFVHMVQTEASSSYSCSYKYFSYVGSVKWSFFSAQNKDGWL